MIERLLPYLLVGVDLFEDGVWLSAVTNMFLSLFAGLLAVRFGILSARTLF